MVLVKYLCVRPGLSFCPRMMLQHSGPTLADISCSALVPCLSPPGSLTLDDFAGFAPLVKEELRHVIRTKRLSSGLGADVSSDGSSSDRGSEALPSGSGVKREVRWRRRRRVESLRPPPPLLTSAICS